MNFNPTSFDTACIKSDLESPRKVNKCCQCNTTWDLYKTSCHLDSFDFKR